MSFKLLLEAAGLPMHQIWPKLKLDRAKGFIRTGLSRARQRAVRPGPEIFELGFENSGIRPGE